MAATAKITLGDAVSWTKGAYLAYLSPWGAHSLVHGRDYSDTLTLSPDLFPNSVAMNWRWPEKAAPSVYNFNAIDFGNYFGTKVQTPVTPLRVDEIGALTQTQSLTLGGDPAKFNVITDFWLTRKAGDFTNRLYEVEVFLHTPAFSKEWANSLTQLGTYTGSGHTWQVAITTGGIRDILFLPKDTSDVLSGSVDIKGMLDWLVGHHVITGNEYFNGLGMGAEVHQGAGSLTINRFSVGYGPSGKAQAAPTDGAAAPDAADTLVLRVSGDSWKGSPHFVVTVDGHQVGGTLTASASHAAGNTQDITLTGEFGPGAHQVAVRFVDDAWGGTAATDRNLYVHQITLDGHTYAGATAKATNALTHDGVAELYTNGTVTFSTAAATTAHASELLLF